MDIEKLIERMKGKDFERDYDCTPFECGVFGLLDEAATALSTLQAENEKLRGELEQVKLVRCKDCKMSRPGGLGYVWCGLTAMPLDGFCSNGQQKED